jgi:hypothetical protein
MDHTKLGVTTAFGTLGLSPLKVKITHGPSHAGDSRAAPLCSRVLEKKGQTSNDLVTAGQSG